MSVPIDGSVHDENQTSIYLFLREQKKKKKQPGFKGESFNLLTFANDVNLFSLNSQLQLQHLLAKLRMLSDPR